MFARHYERAFCRGVEQLRAGDTAAALAAFVEADASDDKHRAISPALFVGILTPEIDGAQAAIPFLERVTASAQELPDKLMLRYASGLATAIRVGERVEFPVEIGSIAASLLLADCYAATGRLDEAIGLMQQLHDQSPTPPMLLALCLMYQHAEEWDEIVHAAAGVSNEDNTTLLLRIVQAAAMEHQGLPDAALEAYRDALKSKKRDPELLKQARYARAQIYLRSGKKSMAKRDLGKLYGDDPDYEDVAELLDGLT